MIAAIILAAGESSRLDSPKQLLSWVGDNLLNHCIQTARSSLIDEIVLVLGSQAEQICLAVRGDAVRVVVNHHWRTGMSSSIRAGLDSLDETVQAAIIMLGDQPFVTSELLNELIRRIASTEANIIAPRVGKVQCNPVLFRSPVFTALINLEGDHGARKLIASHEVEWIELTDKRLLQDIDTWADYQKALKMLDQSPSS